MQLTPSQVKDLTELFPIEETWSNLEVSVESWSTLAPATWEEVPNYKPKKAKVKTIPTTPLVYRGFIFKPNLSRSEFTKSIPRQTLFLFLNNLTADHASEHPYFCKYSCCPWHY